jgi:hypothetical protein
MNCTVVQTRDEGKAKPAFPVRRAQPLRSTFAESDRLLITVLGSKAVYQVYAETFPPVTNLN